MYGVISFSKYNDEKLSLYIFEDLGLANLLFIELHNNKFIPRGYWSADTNFYDCAFESDARNNHSSYGYRMCADINNKSRMLSSQRGTFSINLDRYYFPKSAIINAGTDHCGLKCVLLSINDELLTTLAHHHNLIYPKSELKFCDSCKQEYNVFDNSKEPWNLLDPLDRPHNYEIISIDDINRRKLMPFEALQKHISRVKDNSEIFFLWSEELKALYSDEILRPEHYDPGMIICSDCASIGNYLHKIWDPEKAEEHERERSRKSRRGRGRS